METEKIVKVIKLDPSQKSVLVFRGVSEYDADRVKEEIAEWLKTDHPFCMLSLLSMDMDVKFERVGLEGEQSTAVQRNGGIPIDGEVYRNKETHKKVVVKDLKSAKKVDTPEWEKVADVPHGDGDYSYLCGSGWCRCTQ